jgi:hypothetical protein
MVVMSNLPPKRCPGHRDRNRAKQIGTFALEYAMRPYREEDIEVAGWPAAHSGFTFP